MIRYSFLLLGTIWLLGCQSKNEITIEGETIRHNGKRIEFDQLMELAESVEVGEITLIIREGGEKKKQDLKEFADAVDVLVGGVFDGEDQPLSWKRYLPDNATDIEEFSWSDGFLPDYSYMLKARVSESGFKSFAEGLDLTAHSNNRRYSEETIWLDWSELPQFEGDWWNPKSELTGTYVKEGNDTWSYAKYENGTLYFKSLNH